MVVCYITVNVNGFPESFTRYFERQRDAKDYISSFPCEKVVKWSIHPVHVMSAVECSETSKPSCSLVIYFRDGSHLASSQIGDCAPEDVSDVISRYDISNIREIKVKVWHRSTLGE